MFGFLKRKYCFPFQILNFPSYNMRSSFLSSLSSTLKQFGKKFTIMEMRLSMMHEQAVTQKTRNMQLEKFFKSVFSEVTLYNELYLVYF
jgi:hypothetical protein